MSTPTVNRSTAAPVTLLEVLERANRLQVPTVSVSRADLAALVGEVETLRAEVERLTKERPLAVGEHEEPCPRDRPVAGWQPGKCVKPRGHETHWNGSGDAWQTDVEGMAAEIARMRPAVEAVKVWREEAAAAERRGVSPTLATEVALIAAFDQMATPTAPPADVGAVSAETLALIAAATGTSGAVDVSAEFEDATPTAPAARTVAPKGCDDCSVEPGDLHRYEACPGAERQRARDAGAVL